MTEKFSTDTDPNDTSSPAEERGDGQEKVFDDPYQEALYKSLVRIAQTTGLTLHSKSGQIIDLCSSDDGNQVEVLAKLIENLAGSLTETVPEAQELIGKLQLTLKGLGEEAVADESDLLLKQLRNRQMQNERLRAKNLQDELDELKNQFSKEGSYVICPRCGRANRPEANFCGHCAQPLAGSTNPPSSEQSVPKICPKCGYSNRPKAIFCGMCATSL